MNCLSDVIVACFDCAEFAIAGGLWVGVMYLIVGALRR